MTLYYSRQNAKKIDEFNVKKINEDYLDIESTGLFKIINDNYQIGLQISFQHT